MRTAAAILMIIASLAQGPTTAAAGPVDAREERDRRAAGAPLLVVTAGGVEGLLADLDLVFEEAGRSQFSALVRGLLAVAGNLQGIDREKPFGVMSIIDHNDVPEPVFVYFLPVSDFDDLAATIKATPLELQNDEEKSGLFILKTSDSDRIWHLKRQGDYLFVSVKAAALDQEFPDPRELTGALTERYDLAASLLLGNVPDDLKHMVRDYLHASLRFRRSREEAETDPARLRQNRRLLAAAEQAAYEGERLTIGWRLSGAEKSALLEVVLRAKPQSRLAVEINRRQLEGAPADDVTPGVAAASTNWRLGNWEREILQQLLAGARRRQPGNAAFSPPLEGLFEFLNKAARAGVLRSSIHVSGETPGEFAVSGTLGLSEAEKAGEFVEKTLQALNEQGFVAEFEPGAAVAGGIVLHSVRWELQEPLQQALFDKQVELLIGADARGVLFCLAGAGRALPALKQRLESEKGESAESQRWSPPAEMSVSVPLSQWISLLALFPETREMSDLARRACAEAEGRGEMQLLSGDGEIRLRLRGDAGLVRLAGLWLVGRMEGRR